uniref:Conserved oligomeric Golgi complex subunit 8 n=1 Tax=Amphimedon queenslandica TaxID=400682 RepID=A0A1X7SX87_AMPQE
MSPLSLTALNLPAFLYLMAILKRKLNSLALSRHTQLLEILEIPQLIETCVRNGYYEEALELSAHVKRMEKKHNNIPIIKNIASDIERCSNLMLMELIQQLQGSIQLPSCLRLVGLLRRMDVFNESQLRLKFLQSRDYWLQSVLSLIPKDDRK